MPKPRKGESQKDFVSRCVPIVLKEGMAKDNKQAVAVCHSMYGQGKKKVRNLEHVTVNLTANKKTIRREKLEGRYHIVVPTVMMVEGVHAGSEGPLFYPSKELKKSCRAWNHRPAVLYHPTMNGKGVSACDPIVMNTRKLGLILNTQYDKKLRAETWLDEDRMDQVDERVRQFIDNEQVMEVSTGLYVETDFVEGEWKGEKYIGTAFNHCPDHLALLPDQIGACSVEDGAGLFQLNELSYGTIRRQLFPILSKKIGTDMFYIEDVFDGFLIYSFDGNLYRLNYNKSNDEVSIPDNAQPEEVKQVTEYRTMEGSVIGNLQSALLDRKDQIMAKKDVVDRLIANKYTKWEEKNRSFLMSLDEQNLQMMDPVINKDEEEEGDKPKPAQQQPKPNDIPPTQTPAPPLTPDGKEPGENKDNQMVKDLTPGEQQQAQRSQQNQPNPDQNAGQPNQNGGQPTQNSAPRKLTREEVVEALGPDFMAVHNYGQQALTARRNELVDVINAAWPEKFTGDQLAAKSMPQLEELADLAESVQPPTQNHSGMSSDVLGARLPSYLGAGVKPVHNKQAQKPDVPLLTTPVYNFRKDSKN